MAAWAGWDEAVAAYKRADYATALREWRPLAEQGHDIAQINLGVTVSRSIDVLANQATVEITDDTKKRPMPKFV